MTVDVVLLVVSLSCFIASSLNVPSSVNLQSAGLACWVLTLLV